MHLNVTVSAAAGSGGVRGGDATSSTSGPEVLWRCSVVLS
jgi:hypothetical protein